MLVYKVFLCRKLSGMPSHGQSGSKGKQQKTDLSDTGIISNEQANSINGDGPG